MALQYTTRPISDRSPFTRRYAASPFTVRWGQVLDLLEREYGQLAGKHLVIEVDVPERGIRNDGLLRADAKAASPAVRVAFESKHGPIMMATDRFTRQSYRRESMEDWQHNVYAIAKALEALRMVDRYGVSRSGEQYRGYKAIGGAVALGGGGLSIDDAISILRKHAGGEFVNAALELPADFPVLFKAARATTHPDRNDGERAAWDAVEAAGLTLGLVG